MSGDLFFLILGMIFLLGGGEALVRGASQIAVATGVSPLVVGLTIVAFGTSAPELAVNTIAAWRDSGSLSFGNIFGSNMANIGLILGTAGILRALSIQSVIVSREIPMMLVATAAATIMSFDTFLGVGEDQFDRLDGLLLLLLFCVFLYYTVGDVARQWEGKGSDGGLEDEFDRPAGARGVARAVLMTVGGLGALLYGAELTVDHAISLARHFEVPEVIIGLTLVALGTSLPELVTAILATLRGHIDLAVGNVVGSNIFNILLVGGVTSTLRPIAVPGHGHLDLAVTVVLSVALWWVSSTRNRVIVRAEAGVLLAIYLAYLVWRTAFSG
ncbi:MAG: calcium/sodium antiporter [Myxococcota bacterium]